MLHTKQFQNVIICNSISQGKGIPNSNNEYQTSLLERAATEIEMETLQLTLKGASSPKISTKKATQL